MENKLILSILFLFFNFVPARSQDTLITTKLKVYQGNLLKEDSTQVIFLQIVKKDSVKHLFSIKEVLQIKLADGRIRYYPERTIIIGSTRNQESSYMHPVPLRLKKFTNYTFQLQTGDNVHATLLYMDQTNYFVSEKNAEVRTLRKYEVQNFKRFSDTLNQHKILPVRDDFLLEHRLYDHFEINRILCFSADPTISKLGLDARKKLRTGKIILFCGIAPASIIASGFGLLMINSLGNDQQLFFNGLKLIGTGILSTVPFVIYGTNIIRKGKKLNGQAIAQHNKRF